MDSHAVIALKSVVLQCRTYYNTKFSTYLIGLNNIMLYKNIAS